MGRGGRDIADVCEDFPWKVNNALEGLEAMFRVWSKRRNAQAVGRPSAWVSVEQKLVLNKWREVEVVQGAGSQR